MDGGSDGTEKVRECTELKCACLVGEPRRNSPAFNYADYSTIGVVSLRAYDVEWLAPVVVRR
jgi:hypothetical protein